MKEQWKPVKGFEGKYIVSNFGNVMSIPRTYTNKLGREYTVDGFTLVKHDDLTATHRRERRTHDKRR